ncbi:bifunctional proline dehydrogenase/L-glutamate gamma-semialdehyde dehydrogenase PutA [Catenovulum sediminis]|uniref:Bifunctional protein PutA n=1 Tax=Catenovulum sediminis TaxID=1740262 RepID=A0ABV1RDL5_9ALTE|nr:bifunctional proline dehydrogenase/L-glutamate gamma-semialdehyde dehydrogenase PutA [Catenovulum sediminis]
MQLSSAIFSKKIHLTQAEQQLSALHQMMVEYHLIDDQLLSHQLSAIQIKIPPTLQKQVAKQTIELIQKSREHIQQTPWALETFFAHLKLNSAEGKALMSLAEALLRVEDKPSAIALIKDKMARWQPQKSNQNTFEKLSEQLLTISKKLISDQNPTIKRMSSPLIYAAIKKSMHLLAQHFIYAQNMQEAVAKADKKNQLCSFDCLGEAALNSMEAEQYFNAYQQAIMTLAERRKSEKDIPSQTTRHHSISIKLSALHAKFDVLHFEKIKNKLINDVLQLAMLAKKHDIALTIDAEESDRLMITLAVFEAVRRNAHLQGWQQFGLAVQAYSKRALIELLWLNCLAVELDCTIPIRLVKGAYWDSEIKRAQQLGLRNYPVFRCKQDTDAHFLICAHYLLSCGNQKLVPQFASHNINSICQLEALSKQCKPQNKTIEWQHLHGMGTGFYAAFSQLTHWPIRVYAPVGEHKTVLPYLIRRLLENGANQSFVHKLSDQTQAADNLIEPHEFNGVNTTLDHNLDKRLCLPKDIYQTRKNAPGFDWAEQQQLAHFNNLLLSWPDDAFFDPLRTERSPAQSSHADIQKQLQVIAAPYLSKTKDVKQLYSNAIDAQLTWRETSLETRSNCLLRLAEKLIEKQDALLFLLVYEAGKTRSDALNEWREAIDFCFYYAELAKHELHAQKLPSTVGEENYLHYQAKGTFVCISPWNFPLAIFLGQSIAALVSGNTVIAKPAQSCPVIAIYSMALIKQSGINEGVFQLCLAKGSTIGNLLLSHSEYTHLNLNGVCFTGSNKTAKDIEKLLIEHPNKIPLIAETGGLNAMLVDATAQHEQAILDVLQSAFYSAGQRCSAARILLLHHSIYENFVARLQQCMAELIISEPNLAECDIGPVIHAAAKHKINQYIKLQQEQNRVIYQTPLPKHLTTQNYVAPCLIKIDSINEMREEIFGPVLHLVCYDKAENAVEQLNALGYGLTLCIHSRNTTNWHKLATQAKVGNIYINRNQVGAIVGSHPFGGMNLSGTGPKAGGPNYLKAFVNEKTISENSAAIGGTMELLGTRN